MTRLARWLKARSELVAELRNLERRARVLDTENNALRVRSRILEAEHLTALHDLDIARSRVAQLEAPTVSDDEGLWS